MLAHSPICDCDSGRDTLDARALAQSSPARCARPFPVIRRLSWCAMTTAGRFVFGFAMIALGVFCFRGDFFYTWSGIPDGLPARALFSYANGVYLVIAGVGVMRDRFMRSAALALAGLWLLYTACHVPAFLH